MNEHEDCDHDGMYEGALPTWRFSLWDVAGITAFTLGGVMQSVGNGLGLIARECAAMANHSRQTFDVRQAERQDAEARAAIGEDIRALIEGDGS